MVRRIGIALWFSVMVVYGRADAGETFRDCDRCPLMVMLAPGHYTMGSPDGEEGRFDNEGPEHEVVVAPPFAVGKYEVTRREFDQFVTETSHSVERRCRWWTGHKWERESGVDWREPRFQQLPEEPVVCVAWDDARAHVRWLARTTGKGYRLLSEAEWEYAARSGTTTARPWGSALSRDAANYGTDDCCQPSDYRPVASRLSAIIGGLRDWLIGYTPAEPAAPIGDRDQWGHTAPVGSFPQNRFGLHDMLGNVWEWTEDCWNEGYVGAPVDGSPWLSGECRRRVIRGASWWSDPRRVRSAMRFGFDLDVSSTKIGFRVAMSQ